MKNIKLFDARIGRPMEEKKQEISKYLKTYVNPFLQPMVQQMALQRPVDVVSFIHQYVLRHINNQKNDQNGKHSGSEAESEDDETAKQILKKLEAKKKQKLDKKTSRQGISAEVFGKFNQKQEFKAKVIQKSVQTQNQIKALINKSILFQGLNNEDKQIIIDAMEEKTTKDSEFVIRQGQIGDMLFIVSEGDFDCTKVIKNKETYLKTYKSGDFFGELALMYNAPRAATIQSKGNGKLYGLDRATFINIVQEAATKKRKAFLDVLSKVEILSDVDPYEKEQLCDVLRQDNYQAGEYIVKQGEEGNRFYFIADGQLIAEKEENGNKKTVFEYKTGDYFGEIALIRNTTRQASVKALTSCRVVYIERDAFKRLLGPLEEILKRNEEKYKLYMAK